MTYSLWSRGRLLGHSDLAWGARRDDDGSRCGFFQCSDDARPLVDIVVAIERAQFALDHAPDDETAAADLSAATDRVAALELEIRNADGRVLETSEIGIGDTLQVTTDLEREFDDAEVFEELNEDVDFEEDFLDFELVAPQFESESESANTTLLDSFDDDEPVYSAEDDPMRYVLSVKFVNPADCPPRTWEE